MSTTSTVGVPFSWLTAARTRSHQFGGSGIASTLVSLTVVLPTIAEGTQSDPIPTPTVALAIGSPAPSVNVSTMRIVSGNWSIKPVYEITPLGHGF